jgi:hypothetical protein
VDWMNLAKIAGGVAGAPFTGGASLALTASGVGSMLSGAAKGKEAERTGADTYGLKRDELGLTASTANERALAERARLNLDQQAQSLKSRDSAFQNALRASVVQNFAPAARPRGVANISFINGGPSAGARDSASAMEHDALQRILAGGDTFAPQAAFTPYQLASSAAPQKAGTLEKILGITGLGLSSYGALKDAQDKRDADAAAAAAGPR